MLDVVDLFFLGVEELVKKVHPKAIFTRDKRNGHRVLGIGPKKPALGVYLVLIVIVEHPDPIITRYAIGDVLVGRAPSTHHLLGRDRKIGNIHEPNMSPNLATLVAVEELSRVGKRTRKPKRDQAS